jgi:hypothetical protein
MQVNIHLCSVRITRRILRAAAGAGPGGSEGVTRRASGPVTQDTEKGTKRGHCTFSSVLE